MAGGSSGTLVAKTEAVLVCAIDVAYVNSSARADSSTYLFAISDPFLVLLT